MPTFGPNRPNAPMSLFARAALVACTCLVACALAPAQAQGTLPRLEVPADPPVEVLLVGVFHFAQADTARFDVLAPRRQAEVAEAVRALARFRPTKVMVEWQPYFRQRFIDSTYARYREGAFALPRNEVYQLGYRLAREAGLDRVWAVDHAGYWLGDTLRTVAADLGQMDLLDGTAPWVYARPGEAAPRDSLYERASVGDFLRWMSSPAYQALMYDGYVNRLARVGIVPGDDFDERENEVGAELLAEWVRRNIKIYRHMLARTDYDARDRIVLFIGADHVAPIRQLFEANLNVRVREVGEFL